MKRKASVKPGDKVMCPGIYRGPVRAMAIAKGYIMCRRRYGFPFVVTKETWEQWYASEDKK